MDDRSLASALAYLRAASDIVKASMQRCDDFLIYKAIRNMNTRLEDVQKEFLKLQEQQVSISQPELDLKDKERMRELEQRDADFENYMRYRPCLVSTKYHTETPVAAAQVQLKICGNCMADGVQTFLKPLIGDTILRCPIHGVISLDKKRTKVEIQQQASRWSRRW